MTRPTAYLARMAAFVVAVGALAALFAQALVPYFMGNPWVNGIIVARPRDRHPLHLPPGVAAQSRGRVDREIQEEPRQSPTGDDPRLLLPMATMLGGGRQGRVSLSPVSLRTLLDGIGSRLDETRETSRYMIGLLVFLGLLGTFYGLLETVQSVKGVLGGLNLGGSDVAAAFADLKERLASPLGGMGTAFSASLFGLAGSLVLGFLDLQAGLAQNRFYNELEEQLSGYTRLTGGGPSVELGEASVPAYIQALLEQTADSIDNLQRTCRAAKKAAAPPTRRSSPWPSGSARSPTRCAPSRACCCAWPSSRSNCARCCKSWRKRSPPLRPMTSCARTCARSRPTLPASATTFRKAAARC